MTKHLKTQDAKTEPQLNDDPTMTTTKPETQAQADQPIAQPPEQRPSAVEIAAISDEDIAALATEARDLTDDIRVGDDLRFKKGRWSKTTGDADSKVGSTTPFAVDVRSYKRGWIKWLDRKPVFKAIGRPIDGFISPVRSRLPDQDEKRWPRDGKGVPQDPWQENFQVVMRDLGDGKLCTWTTTSWCTDRRRSASS